MAPSLFPSFPESARGFLGGISSNLRLRSNSLFKPPSNAASSTTGPSSSKLGLTSPSTDSVLLPPKANDFQDSPRASSAPSTPSGRLPPPRSTTDSSEILRDGDFELEFPSKKRFEPGFSFQFMTRNSSTGSIFSNISAGFKPSHQRSQSQQPQPQQQQQQASNKQSKHKLNASFSGSVSSIFLPLKASGADSASESGINIEPGAGVHFSGEEAEITGRHVVQAELVITVEAEPEPEAESEAEPEDLTSTIQMKLANSLPLSVHITGLPEYFPSDDFGRNSKRNEKYARLRLVGLREHQQILVRMLGELLDADNVYRQTMFGSSQNPQGQGVGQGIGQGSEVASTASCKCDSQARRTRRRQRREAAVQGYQKAILDLWQTDQNLCYWLSRYIRTTRRLGKSLDFILASMPIASAPVPTASKSALSKHSEQGSWRSPQPCFGGGVSNPELERMGILQSKLLSYVEKPAPTNYTAWFSISSPTMDEPSKPESAPLPIVIAPSSATSQQPLYAGLTVQDMTSKPLPELPLASDTNPVSSDLVEPVCEDVSELVVITRSPSGTILPPLSPFLPAPMTPPPAIPAPCPPGRISRSTSLLTSSMIPSPPPPTPQSSTSLSHIRLTNIVPFQQQRQIQQREREQYQGTQESRTPNTSERLRPTFQNLDDLEASIFVGFHMQSLHKASEFLNQFNKETVRSRIMLERFKVAKDVYEHRVMGQPWKIKLHRNELKRARRGAERTN